MGHSCGYYWSVRSPPEANMSVVTALEAELGLTRLSGALQAGQGGTQPGTLLRAGAQPPHGLTHLDTRHLQQGIQRQLHRHRLRQGGQEHNT